MCNSSGLYYVTLTKYFSLYYYKLSRYKVGIYSCLIRVSTSSGLWINTYNVYQYYMSSLSLVLREKIQNTLLDVKDYLAPLRLLKSL